MGTTKNKFIIPRKLYFVGDNYVEKDIIDEGDKACFSCHTSSSLHVPYMRNNVETKCKTLILPPKKIEMERIKNLLVEKQQ